MNDRVINVEVDDQILAKAIKNTFPVLVRRWGVPHWVAGVMQEEMQRGFDESIASLRRTYEECRDEAESWFPVPFIRWGGYAGPSGKRFSDELNNVHTLDGDGHAVARGHDRMLLRDQGRDLAVEVLIHRDTDAEDAVRLLEKIVADLRDHTEVTTCAEPAKTESSPRKRGPIPPLFSTRIADDLPF